MTVRYGSWFAAGASLLILTACDNGPSAVRPQAADAGASGSDAAATAPSVSTGESAARPPVPTVDGAPMWSETSRYSAQENAQRAYERNGEAFGATSLDDFVKKAHAFVSDPPAGTQTLKRGNGDTLFYDPAGNVFAVATAQGAPRTMFKPDDGPAYWEEQKTREAERSSRAAD